VRAPALGGAAANAELVNGGEENPGGHLNAAICGNSHWFVRVSEKALLRADFAGQICHSAAKD